MTKPMIKIHDIETNQVIERAMSDQEFAEHETKLAEIVAQETAAQMKANDKAALLEKLGITADEAALLLS